MVVISQLSTLNYQLSPFHLLPTFFDRMLIGCSSDAAYDVNGRVKAQQFSKSAQSYNFFFIYASAHELFYKKSVIFSLLTGILNFEF